MLPLVTPCYPVLPLVTLVTPCYPCYIIYLKSVITESTETYVAFKIQSDSINTDDKRAIESVHIKQVEFRENVRAFFS